MSKKRKPNRISPKLETVFVYLVECKNRAIYTGITNNINRRMNQHKGKISGGARYTREHGFNKLLGYRPFKSRSLAMREEMRIKKNFNHAMKRSLLDTKGWIKK